MCGIAGKVNAEPERPADRAVVARMTAALAHRGPDDGGVVALGPVALGHRRLSVIDLSRAARQPMANERRTLWLAFNGEIYNFRELRADLERRGCRFRTSSDTEVLLRLYEREGPECLTRLRGMFAFAVWDTERRELALARDRLGVKPLFYHVGPEGLSFASELKGLLQDPDVDRRWSPAALRHYLALQYVPTSLCAFEGVHKLPPAHWLRWRGGRVEVSRYWALGYRPKRRVRGRRAELEVAEELRERLDEAVRIRLVSDVPLGAFLSGGIDSSAVVAFMARHSQRPVRTYSIRFEEGAYDESASARRVAERFGAEHTEFTLRPDVAGMLPTLARHYDEPYADASAIPTWLLAELARHDVTVALTGDGGDESFAGYDRHLANVYAAALGPLRGVAASHWVRALVRRMPHGRHHRDPRWRFKRLVEQLGDTPEGRNASWQCQLDPAALDRLCTPAFHAAARGGHARGLLIAALREVDADEPLDRVLGADVRVYLAACLLVKADIATMAHGLEARSPFLDHRLVEFAAGLPAGLKLRHGRTKWILREALRGLVPEDVLRGRKRGFDLPLDEWLRGSLAEPLHDLTLGPRARARGLFERAAVERMVDEHRQRRWNWAGPLWTLMMLELWFRERVDAPAERPAAGEPASAPGGGARRVLGPADHVVADH